MISKFKAAVALLIAGAFLVCGANGARAQEYPNKPIRMIIPAAPGGGTDALGRVLAEGIQRQLGQPVILDHRAGASGRIAGEAAASAPADGYTLLLAYAGVLTVNPAIFKSLKYDPERDFVPISLFAEVANVLVVHPSVRANNVAELIALARAQPGKLNYASSGHGTSIFLAMELLRQRVGIDVAHIVYKGGAPALTDVMAGQVEMMFNNLVEVLPVVKAGRVRALAIGSARRSSLMPDVPTFSESGLPGYESTTWYGLVGPAGTPDPIVYKLHEAARTIQHQPEVVARLATMGAETLTMPRAEFAALIRKEIVQWTSVIQKAGIKPDQ